MAVWLKYEGGRKTIYLRPTTLWSDDVKEGHYLRYNNKVQQKILSIIEHRGIDSITYGYETEIGWISFPSAVEVSIWEQTDCNDPQAIGFVI